MDPSDSLPAPGDFSRPALYARSLPDGAAGEGLSCSVLLCPNVPPPETPERSSTRSGPECCLWPSPRHDRLGPLKHLSADNMTWLQRSPVVAARWFAPLSFKGFRHSARLGRISPPGWSLLPGAPALTRTGLSPARTTRPSGRTMAPFYAKTGRAKEEKRGKKGGQKGGQTEVSPIRRTARLLAAAPAPGRCPRCRWKAGPGRAALTPHQRHPVFVGVGRRQPQGLDSRPLHARHAARLEGAAR